MVINFPLGRLFSFLTKQYIGVMAKSMSDTPIARYYFPLYLIGRNSGRISQQELADQLLMDKVSLVRILDALTKDGMITRTVNPKDRRQHLLSVTKLGEPWIKKIEENLQKTNDYFLSFLPEDDGEKLVQMLNTLIEQTKEAQIEEIELYYNRTNDTAAK